MPSYPKNLELAWIRACPWVPKDTAGIYFLEKRHCLAWTFWMIVCCLSEIDGGTACKHAIKEDTSKDIQLTLLRKDLFVVGLLAIDELPFIVSGTFRFLQNFPQFCICFTVQ